MPESAARVLIVDDTRMNRLVIVQMLRRIPGVDIEIVEAETAARALELLGDGEFDVVLMDVQMPGMSGLEATRAIRSGKAGEQNREVPIIAMTAHSGSEDERVCYDAGMTGYLSKPIRLQKFTETLRATLKA